MATAEIITPPAPSATAPADAMFNAVFHHSSDFRIAMDFDTALGFIRRIGPWNDFDPALVIETLEEIDRLIPRRFYGEGNPNNGTRSFTMSVGREGSPVVYLDMYEFDSGIPMSDSAFRAVCQTMEFIAKADEAHADVRELAGLGGRRITFRFWWN